MSADASGAIHAGPRVRLVRGEALLMPAVPTPAGWLPARFSVISPGTEQRSLAATVRGSARMTGYMNLADAPDSPGGWLLAPVPHGAAFTPDHPGAVTTPPGTSLAVATLARFQLMAAVGLDRLPAAVDLDEALVVGSGPVALGCVLELRRRSARTMRVLTSRPMAPIAKAPGVRVIAEADLVSAAVVIDAAGRPERAAALVADGGTLGLLGTPGTEQTVPALAAHRGGWTVVGMHELAGYDRDRYRNAYIQVATWLTAETSPALVTSWCRQIPGELAPQIFELLGSPHRPAEPVLILEWAP